MPYDFSVGWNAVASNAAGTPVLIRDLGTVTLGPDVRRGAAEWQALLERLRVAAVDYQLADVPLAGELQLFVALAPGVVVEFVTALRHVHH